MLVKLPWTRHADEDRPEAGLPEPNQSEQTIAPQARLLEKAAPPPNARKRRAGGGALCLLPR